MYQVCRFKVWPPGQSEYELNMGDVWSNITANQMGALEFQSKTFIHDRFCECKILFQGG